VDLLQLKKNMPWINYLDGIADAFIDHGKGLSSKGDLVTPDYNDSLKKL